MTMSFDPTLSILEQAARFAERRQSVLAGNIANLDTPNYKTRDLPVADFRRAVADALAGQQTVSAAGSPPGDAAESFRPELFEAREKGRDHLTFQDGADRNLERETTELTKNALEHRMTVEVLAARLRLLESVITGRP